MNSKKNFKYLAAFFAILIGICSIIGLTFNSIKDNLTLGLDLKGGFEILYEVSPLNEGASLDMSAVANSVSKRVDILGVSEPQIIIEGTDRIRVQLAGVNDPNSARSILGTTANLTFRDINDNLLSDASIIQEGGASLSYDEQGRPVVSLKIKDTSLFNDITKRVSQMPAGQNIMVIWLDYEEGDSYQEEANKVALGAEPKYISAASVNFAISGDSVISGNFTETEARTLAGLINSGSLPVKMSEISSNVVSADYGIDALNTTALAGIIGTALIFLFMIFVYKLPGLVSSIMLVIYIYAVFAIYNLIGAVFTLPGIAALVLGIGMTVDANVITFERIKDELYKGRTIKNATLQGQKLSFAAIFDAQFTTLLAGLIMYVFGNGSVKGFATMLMITVVCTLVLNVAISRFLLNLIVKSGYVDDKYSLFGVKKSHIPDVTKNEEQFYFGKFKGIDYIKKSSKLIYVSIAIIGLAICVSLFNIVTNKGAVNLGIDFSSGTKLSVTSHEEIDVKEVESIISESGYNDFKYQLSGDKTVNAITSKVLSLEELNTIKAPLTQRYGIEPGDNVITPTVGRDLVNNAVILSLLAWVVMMAYIAVRFSLDFAIGSIVALIQDVLIVLSIFAIFRLEVNTELISVILAIIGYSINNTIVVFERVKEELKEYRGKLDKNAYKTIVNSALDNTLFRSLNSSITTIIPIVVLLFIGSKAIFTFNFAMLVGLIAGTFSSMFIAPYVWYLIRIKYKPKKKNKNKAKKEDLDEYTIKGINA